MTANSLRSRNAFGNTTMSLNSLTRSVSKVSGKVPLRIVLVVPFVIQIFAAVGLVGWLSFRNGQKAVNDVATQLRSEISDRIQQRLESYLETPHLIDRINVKAARLGELNIQDTQRMGRYFWEQIQMFKSVNLIYVGTQQGEYIGAKRPTNDTLTINFANRKTGGTYHVYAPDNKGNPVKLLRVTTQYDPRIRPWYKQTVKTGRPSWSPIYPFFEPPSLGITAAHPLYDENGKLQAIFASDFALSDISKFLNGLKIGRSGQSFIMERSGALVATSTTDRPYIMDKDGSLEQLKAIASRNPITRSAAEHLISHFGNLTKIDSPQQLAFKINNKRQFLQVTPLKDPYGIDWLVVVVIPESDFMGQIDINTRSTILLCLVALVVATLAGVATSRWIIRPIHRLSAAADALSKGEWDNTVQVDREDELGVLASAFNSMALQLQDSFASLEANNAELQRLDQLKDEFLANTSHELRTPLNGIIGIAESLIEGATGQLPEKTQSNLATIANSGRRLSNLVNDILDFSQLKHKTIELHINSIGMREIAEVVLTLSQPLIGKKSLRLINSISPDVPLVDADENRVQQILHNLIGNAIKFTELGIIEVSAEVVNSHLSAVNSEKLIVTNNGQRTAQSRQLAITVSDTGIGISTDKLDKIFESFEQADGSTARVYGGTGLGLAVTKQLVELHKGNIYVSSTVGVGSRFTFTLPLSQSKVKKIQEISPIRTLSAATFATVQTQYLTDETLENLTTPKSLTSKTGDLKILIVDDEPINLQVLFNNLSLQNYSITQAANGLEALEILEKGFKPDLILLDVMMPRMTGYEVCRRIRETLLQTEVPIVMLTAKNQISDLVEGFNSGANDYLTKPFSKDELFTRIKTHIRLAKINAAYGRFVPHEFLQFLGHESIVDVKLGDHIQKDMTILFADIRSFTTLSEEMSPNENFNFLNSYLKRVSPVIRAYNGFIDKYVGDAVMALFPASADDAVQSAIEMQKQVSLYNEHRQNSDYAPIAIGIGLHTGSLMLGTIGEEERMETTVISDAVNLASRLQGLTKVYGASIVISGELLSRLDDPTQYFYRFLDKVQVKGKKESVSVFEICDGNLVHVRELKMQTRLLFEQGIILYYQQNFTQAYQLFEQVLQVNGEDKAAGLYIKRCENYQKYGVPEAWEGVEVMDVKG